MTLTSADIEAIACAVVAKLRESNGVELPEPTRKGRYTTEQYQALVKNPDILRELSRQDTSRRRKKMCLAQKIGAEA